ncbi:alpha/beta hydrolase family protein [Pseudonocardia hispaniensis]|uniref:Alpha/beta hydrolase family protein n=1 Tax=Pseudonocardia hispaniensis TaxID=904933 RepID=A0ABW1IXX3_9PSEU
MRLGTSGPGPARRPRLEPVRGGPADPASVVLVLHGGRAVSHEPAGRRRRLAYLRMLPFARMLSSAGPTVYLLHYRYRGWNAPAMDAVVDTRWALDEIGRRHPRSRTALLGHSMGGRAALRAADAPNVVAVCALAPWLDGSDPVEQLSGRSVLIAHGDLERWTDPRESYAYAVRAKQVTGRTCRFEVLGDGHAMVRRPAEWNALVRRFLLGELGLAPEDPRIREAMRRPAPHGLAVRAG